MTPLSNKIARPLAEGLKNEVVCREDRITRIIPQKLLDVREAIHSALGQVESHLVETNWTMAPHSVDQERGSWPDSFAFWPVGRPPFHK